MRNHTKVSNRDKLSNCRLTKKMGENEALLATETQQISPQTDKGYATGFSMSNYNRRTEKECL